MALGTPWALRAAISGIIKEVRTYKGLKRQRSAKWPHILNMGSSFETKIPYFVGQLQKARVNQSKGQITWGNSMNCKAGIGHSGNISGSSLGKDYNMLACSNCSSVLTCIVKPGWQEKR